MLFRFLATSTIVIVTLLTVSSCLLDDDELYRTEEEILFQGQPIILGKKLQNPFSVTNMKQAYANIRKNNLLQCEIHEITIQPTHFYVRFLPADQAQYDQLKNDTLLHLSDHPIDYEIVQQGDFYHDPSLSATQPTYQYATVPLKYVAPEGIPYEIIEEIYLPQQEVILQNGRVSSEEFINTLEDEAFALTGNYEKSASEANTDARKSSKWFPAGRILVWDSRLNKHIPLAGVKVQARRWFNVKTTYTDESGYFKIRDGFRHKAQYSIIWEREKFDIRSGTFGQARLNGPKRKGDWNLTINRNGMSFHYAHVFRAAFRYYYGDIGGLTRPTFKLKYSVFDKRGNHAAKNIGNWSAFGINPNILIYRYSPLDGTENDSDEMFSTTCHETAHSTHMQVMNAGAIQYGQVSETIRESWAIGVEWFITQKEYKEKGISNYGEANFKVPVNYPSLYGFQYWNKKRNETLTSLFIDIVDKNNQYGQSFGGSFRTGTVTDPVCGYSFAGIESGCLKKIYGLSSLGEQLKANKPADTTDEQIDVLLKHF